MEPSPAISQPTLVDRRIAAFVGSEVFTHTFREGMALVERTANYLDGEGRETSKTLPRHGALAYANASMRVTTHLMQAASWLLVLRAVRERDMSAGEAADGKYRLQPRETRPERTVDAPLPPALVEIIDASEQLYDRIKRLDAELFETGRESSVERRDVADQLRSLRDAFGIV